MYAMRSVRTSNDGYCSGGGSPEPPGETLLIAKLARKRARDRKAQQAMRDRTKNQLDALKAEVAELSQQLKLRNATETIDNSSAGEVGVFTPLPSEGTLQLEADNDVLPDQAARMSTSLQPPPCNVLRPVSSSAFGVSLDSSVIESWVLVHALPIEDSFSPHATNTSPVSQVAGTSTYLLCLVRSIWHAVEHSLKLSCGPHLPASY